MLQSVYASPFMDFIRQAQRLAEQAQKQAKTVVSSVDTTIEGVKRTTEELAGEISTKTAEVASSSMAAIENVKTLSVENTQRSLHNFSEAIEDTMHYAIGAGASGVAIADALKNLPKTAEELVREMPKIASRLKYGAGLRAGDIPRSDADVMKLFNKIPGTSKLGASESKIWEFLADKHGSHIVSRHQGGSNAANNIVWEVGTDNIRRGATAMTGGEQVYIHFYNAVDSILKNSTTIAQLGLAATGTAILTQAVITAVSYSLDLYRGDITVEEFKDRVIAAAATTGIITPIFFLIFIMVLALFPPLAVFLSAPAVVAGFNALFGIGVAVPIIQSIVRHIQAGGFGPEVADGYQELTQEAQNFLESSVQEVTSFTSGIKAMG